MTSTYYFLKNSSGSDVGCVPQDKAALGEIDLNEVRNKKSFAPTDVTLNLNYIQLANKAKLTDFVRSAILKSNGFLISDKAWGVLQKHNLCAHQNIPAVLEFKNKKYENYQWFHFAEDNTKDIVYHESSFLTFKNSPWDIPNWDFEYKKVELKNHDELLTLFSQIGGMRDLTAEKLTLQKKLTEKDMIILRGFENFAVISQRLKDEIEKSKLNGMEFKAVPFTIQFA